MCMLIRQTYIRCTFHVSYAYVKERYMYNSAYIRPSLCISFSYVNSASDALGIRWYKYKVCYARNKL